MASPSLSAGADPADAHRQTGEQARQGRGPEPLFLGGELIRQPQVHRHDPEPVEAVVDNGGEERPLRQFENGLSKKLHGGVEVFRPVAEVMHHPDMQRQIGNEGEPADPVKGISRGTDLPAIMFDHLHPKYSSASTGSVDNRDEVVKKGATSEQKPLVLCQGKFAEWECRGTACPV